METRHDLEHTTERLTEGLRCPWKWGHCPPADDGTLDRTMTALQAVVQRYPDRCLVVSGDFNIPDINWRLTERGWEIPTTMRPSRRALNFVDACGLSDLKQYVCHPTRGANTLDLVLCNRRA